MFNTILVLEELFSFSVNLLMRNGPVFVHLKMSLFYLHF